jgi:hypothetical protein
VRFHFLLWGCRGADLSREVGNLAADSKLRPVLRCQEWTSKCRVGHRLAGRTTSDINCKICPFCVHLHLPAKCVKSGANKDDWIPSPVTLGESMPVSVAEVVALYQTNARECELMTIKTSDFTMTENARTLQELNALIVDCPELRQLESVS